MGQLIALTGGIGCGKSTVSRIFQSRGWKVIDTDEIAHGVLDSSDVQIALRLVFGNDIIKDGKVDRKTLGKIVYYDSNKLKVLNALVHPKIRSEWTARLNKLQQESSNNNIVVVIPLFFELEPENELIPWKIWCIAASEEIQLKRVMDRGFTEEEAKKRINAQLPIRHKTQRSDVVFWNNGTEDSLRSQIITELEDEDTY